MCAPLLSLQSLACCEETTLVFLVVVTVDKIINFVLNLELLSFFFEETPVS
jgi:hypothetical protein